MTIDLSVATIIFIASSITIVGGAVKILFEAKKALTKPLTDFDEKLKHHDRCLENDLRHLEKLDGLVEELGDAINLIVSSDCVILDHLKEGNHTGEIDEKIKELDKWLVSRKEYKV